MIYLVVLLAGITIMNNVDRVLLPMLVEPIRVDLALSDGQMGALTGVIFAFFYTLAAIPVSLLADRFGRSLMLSACVTLWSVATALSGGASSFLTMALARIGVAVGESGGTPIAHAIVGKHVRPSSRSRVLSVLGASAGGGSMVGLVVGGALGEAVGWRWTFVIMGIPGVILGLLLLRAIPRHVAERSRGVLGPIAAMTAFVNLAKVMFRQPLFCALSAAAVFCVMGVTAMTAWKVALAMRAFSLPLGEVGRWLGFGVGIGGVFGYLLGGIMASKADRPSLRRPAYLVILGGAAFIAASMSSTWPMMLSFLVVGGVLSSVWYAPVYSAIQWLAPEHGRSQAAALALVLVGIFGISVGPTAVGFISDYGQSRLGVGSLRLGVALMSAMIIVGAGAMLVAARMMDKMPARGR